MYEDDYFNPNEPNDYDIEKKIIGKDSGMNYVTRKVGLDKVNWSYLSDNPNAIHMKKKIKVFTSSGVGSNIRDAETGEYYHNKVGTKDEYLFFKVMISTGECDNSNTLFFCSPHHYENHLHSQVDPEIVSEWETRRDARLRELKSSSKNRL